MRDYIKKAEYMKYTRAKGQIQEVYSKIRKIEMLEEYDKESEVIIG